jgi:tetratricopeptide (TPR) repeat protein
VSRFSNLEFDGQSSDHARGQKAQVKDEAYYCAAARAAFEAGSFESGLRLYSKVLEFNPRNPEAWTGQVRMLIELGEFREAGLWADKALEHFPHEAELLAAKAVALARSGDLQGALAFSDSALEERGNTPYLWLSRADVLLARDESRADYCFEKALSLAPEDWWVAWLAARIRYYYRQFAVALRLVQQALELNTTHFVLWLELGRCQEALGLVGPARHSFAQARQLNPQCEAARVALTNLSSIRPWRRFAAWARGLFQR